MALVSSTALRKEPAQMSEKIADKDIVETNSLGQNVVIVPKGQPIPAHLSKAADRKKAAEGVVQQDTAVADEPVAGRSTRRSSAAKRSSSRKKAS
jgi:hypothetical protein